MPQMFPFIDVLGQAWHGMFWGFKAALRYRPEQGVLVNQAPARPAKAGRRS